MTNNNDHQSVLEQAQIGMPVYDKHGQNIGQIVRVRVKNRLMEDAAGKKVLNPINDPEWFKLIAAIIEPDDREGIEMAREVWQEGYIKLGHTTLHGFYRFILPAQIKKIDERGLHLNVSREAE